MPERDLLQVANELRLDQLVGQTAEERGDSVDLLTLCQPFGNGAPRARDAPENCRIIAESDVSPRDTASISVIDSPLPLIVMAMKEARKSMSRSVYGQAQVIFDLPLRQVRLQQQRLGLPGPFRVI